MIAVRDMTAMLDTHGLAPSRSIRDDAGARERMT
jgi:hypothetical protein